MILGLPDTVFLGIHITLSLIAIVSGVIVLFAMAGGLPTRAMAGLFLATTVLTSITGFPLPPFGLDPPRIIGILSLGLLGIAIAGRFMFKLQGMWRALYVLTASAALYLNCFVLVIQSFQKIGLLHDLAPLGNETPILVTQAALAGAFIILTILALMKFRPVEIDIHHDRVEHVTRT